MSGFNLTLTLTNDLDTQTQPRYDQDVSVQ